jgi:hypothetical protein
MLNLARLGFVAFALVLLGAGLVALNGCTPNHSDPAHSQGYPDDPKAGD